MSISSFPRLYVKGEMSFDPGLVNNFQVYDQANVSLDTQELQKAVPGATTHDEYRVELPKRIAGSWNHYGTHRATFESSMRVTGVSLTPASVTTSDELVQKEVQLNGRIVDLIPHNDNGTQVFFDQMQFGGIATGLSLIRRKRMTCRYLNFTRNVGSVPPGWSGAHLASGTWEVAFPKAGLRFENEMASEFLLAMQALLGDNQSMLGVAFRFRTYCTLYYQNGLKNSLKVQPRSGSELRAHYANGENFSNPAYSTVTGVLFPWVDGDHEGHPGGRILVPSAAIPRLTTDETRPVYLGTSFVEFDASTKRAVLDFGDLVPEKGVDLEKVSIGDISVTAEAGGASVKIATLKPGDYSRTMYEQTAGLVDVDLSSLTQPEWSAIEHGSLTVTVEDVPALVELPLAVVVEDRDHYVDQGEKVLIKVRVMDKGRPAANDTLILVTEYDVGGVQSSQTRSLGIVATDPNGFATVEIDAAPRPGFSAIVFRPFRLGEAPPSEGPYSQSDFHALIRTLPFDDLLESATPDSALTWSWIYENIFAVWDVTNPVMARTTSPAIKKPLHDRFVMEQQAARIKKLIDRDSFESEAYMPVTRDLSRGKRRLLNRWCDLVIAGSAPPEAPSSGVVLLSTHSRRVVPFRPED